MKKILIMAFLMAVVSQAFGVSEELLSAIEQVESGGRTDLVGDITFKNKAYGSFQIRKPYLDDVNRLAGRKILSQFERKLVMADVVNRDLARWAAREYLKAYGRHYEKKTGNPATDEVLARIHNGGPSGWKKSSTDHYWMKVKKELAK